MQERRSPQDREQNGRYFQGLVPKGPTGLIGIERLGEAHHNRIITCINIAVPGKGTPAIDPKTSPWLAFPCSLELPGEYSSESPMQPTETKRKSD
jgi:hypothetical protein